MRIVVAPDEFTGTLSAVEAAAAISSGWLRTAPDDEVLELPVSDGGPGFVCVLHSVLGGSLLPSEIDGPLGATVTGSVLLVGDTGYVESAQATGRPLLAEAAPTLASSYGVGQLMLAALERGASRIVVGLGGTMTTDGGAGLLAALGATAVSHSGADGTALLRQGGAALLSIAAVDLGPALERTNGIEIVAATDVDSPLLGPRGAALGFGPQKGASPTQVNELEAAVAHFAKLVGRSATGRDPALALGAGAAGGQGYALLALGGTRASGSQLVLGALGLAAAVATADLVITGEGSFDWQSLRGKVVGEVARLAVEAGRPCLVLAGQVHLGRRDYSPVGVVAARSVADYLGSVEAALIQPAIGLAALAERVALTWSRQ
ncbi:MAG: glycerate kinase [Actinomycetes bacterium]